MTSVRALRVGEWIFPGYCVAVPGAPAIILSCLGDAAVTVGR